MTPSIQVSIPTTILSFPICEGVKLAMRVGRLTCRGRGAMKTTSRPRWAELVHLLRDARSLGRSLPDGTLNESRMRSARPEKAGARDKVKALLLQISDVEPNE